MGLGYALAGALGGAGDWMMKEADRMKEQAERERREQRDDRIRQEDRAYKEQWRDEGRAYEQGLRRETIERGASALTGGIDFERANYVRGRFIEMGYPEHVADGLVGNILQESGGGIDTGAVGDNGNAFGMAQWNGPRRKAYLAYAQEKGKDPTDMDTQIEYLDYEMRTSEKDAYDAIMRTTSAEEAARVASEKFWRPGVPHVQRRMAYARQLAEVASDPQQTAAVRNEAASRLDALQGKQKAVKLTGEEWVERDGKEVLMGRDDSGQMRPYTDTDGKPITRAVRANSDNKPRQLSAGLSNRIDEWADEQGLDDATARKFKLRAEKFIQEGMTETQAWDATLALANKTEDQTVEQGGIFGIGGSERVVPGTYDGTFRESSGGLGPAPGREAQATPSMPQDPSQGGLPQPKTEAEFKKLAKGQRYIDPEGNVRVKS